MATDNSKDISKTQKAVILIGVLIAVGGTIKYLDPSAQKLTVPPTKQSIAESLPKGDADSPIDTIRALKQDAKKAAKQAASTNANLDEYKKTAQAQIDSLSKQLNAQGEQASIAMQRGVGELKSELSNFRALMEGELKAQSKGGSGSTSAGDPNEWIEIPPMNTLPSNQGISGETSQLQKIGLFQGEGDEKQGYAVNNGFLLTDTTTQDISTISVNDSGLVPVATIPSNSPLMNSVTLSTLIGRIPKGGQVFEAYNFYIYTGADNLTSQNHEIPFLEEAIWRGVATGDKDLECVRGALTHVTFVFTDGTIQEVEGTRQKPLAEIVTPTGSNCIPGEYVSNTAKYIAMFGLGGGIAGLGEAIANNESVTSVTSSGSILSRVDGDAGKFLAGKALSEGAQQAARIIESEYNNSFASVVKEPGIPINMMALRQIAIDYDVNGRKVSYVNPDDYQ